MNKSVILNASWLAIAAAAFIFGRSTVTTDDENSQDSNGSSKSSAYRSAAGSPGNGGSRTGSKTGRNTPGGTARTGVTVNQFLRETDSLVANKLFADLLLEMDASNARGIFDALHQSGRDGIDSGQQMALFLQAWGKLDGPAAMEAVGELGGDFRRRGLAGVSAITGWASVDPEAAKAHLASIENDWEKNMLAHGVVSGLAASDPNAATDFVFQIDAEQRAAIANAGEEIPREGIERFRAYAFDRQLGTIANAQIARGMTTATSWAEGLPEGAIKASAFDRVAESFAEQDPAGAADWVKSHAGNEYAERAVREVAEELGREDPGEAVRWLGELPEASQNSAIGQSMERWAKKDPVAAGEYLTDMPQSATRDNAVSSYAREVDGSDPQIAAEWAGSIQNEEMRTDTLNAVARSWVRSEPEEARAWLPNSGLPAEQQERILSDADRRDDVRARFRDARGER